MPHVILLGDSIFDNQVYVRPGEPAVIDQLRTQLPAGWHATLRAVDGSVTAEVPQQLTGLTDLTPTHLVVSTGGNDALRYLHVLDEPVASVAQALARFAAIQDQFEQTYRRMLDAVLAYGLVTAVCTIYNGNFPDARYQRVATVGAALFDDVIVRLAVAHGLPVLELRLICTDAEDYANPIEPSARGGDRIARAIATLLTTPSASLLSPNGGAAMIYAGPRPTNKSV
jgi:hypothetical protein